jgi:hypothetical protein
MTPEWVLLLCFAGVNVGLAYAWWIAIRPTLFQADLQAIRARLDAAMKAEGKTDDPGYLFLRAVITLLIEKASYLSVPVIVLSLRARRTGRAASDAPLPDWIVDEAHRLVQREGIHSTLEQTKSDLLLRVLFHLALSPGNYLALLLLLLLGKTKEFASVWSSLRRVIRAIDPPLPAPTHAA